MDSFFQNFQHIAPARSGIEFVYQGINKQLKSLKDDVLGPQDGKIRTRRFLGPMGSLGAGKCEIFGLKTEVPDNC
jgi:hypothetical protein